MSSIGFIVGYILAVVFCVSLTLGCFADSLWISGVQTRALGYAVSGSDLGLESAIKNPATLSSIRKPQWKLDLFNDYQGDSYSGIGGAAFRLGHSVLGIQIPYQIISQIPVTSESVEGQGIKTDTTSDTTLTPTVSWSMPLSNQIWVGSSVKGAYQTLMTYKAFGVGFDIGMLAKMDEVQIGASYQNLWSTKNWKNGASETMPKRLSIGGQVKLLPDIHLFSDWNFEANESTLQLGFNLLLSSEINFLMGIPNLHDPSRFNLGVDLRLNPLAMTLAYEYHPQLGQSYSLGIRHE